MLLFNHTSYYGFTFSQEEWNLPKYVDGVDVKVILKRQCAALYRGWRYRLKEKYYTGYSNAAAKANKPPEIDASDWNWLIDHYWSDPKNQVKKFNVFCY